MCTCNANSVFTTHCMMVCSVGMDAGMSSVPPGPVTSTPLLPSPTKARMGVSPPRAGGPQVSPGGPGFPTRHSFMALESSPTKDRTPQKHTGNHSWFNNNIYGPLLPFYRMHIFIIWFTSIFSIF